MSIFSSFNKLFNSHRSNTVVEAKNEKKANTTKAHFRENLSKSEYSETDNQDVLSILCRGFRALN